MDKPCDSLYKRREIAFCTLHPDPDQPGAAAALLVDVEGITEAKPESNSVLHVRYQLSSITLADIEQLLQSRGFHLDNGLMHRLKRALVHYTEETQRANMGCNKGDPNSTEKVFVNRYRKREHGCQDDRPDHWRRYL
jgi:hypothetical protein